MMVLELIKELLFPRKCLFCGGILNWNESDICRECRSALPEYEGSRSLSGVDACCILWYYEGTVRDSLIRFKFHDRPDYAEVYGPMLAMKLRQRCPDAQVVTWVPVSRERRKERGYDQSELLAKAAARELGLPVEKMLMKCRHNPAQSGIEDAKARKDNVRDAYRICGDPEGRRIILVDDILTTGATAGECAKVLRTAGAAKIYLTAVASGKGRKEEQQP